MTPLQIACINAASAASVTVMRRLLLLLATGAPACTADPCPKGSLRGGDGLCYQWPDDEPGTATSETAGDSGVPVRDTAAGAVVCPDLPTSLVLGTPISALGSSETDEFMENLDVALLGDGRALVGANNGWSVLDVASGAFTHVEWAGARSVFRLAADPGAGRAWGGTQSRALYRFDISVDPPVVVAEHRPWSGWHGDVAASGGNALVAVLDEGAWLLDGDGEVAGVLPGDATAVALDGDVGWVAGTERLVRVDWSSPSEPRILGEVALPGPAIDAAGSADQVVLALGGLGVVVVRADADTLQVSELLDTRGAAYGVAMDGDQFWAATWHAVSVGAVVDGQPLWLGAVPSDRYALGIDAHDGTAVVADWTRVSRMLLVPGVGGPELELPDRVDVARDTDGAFTVFNGGAATLTASLDGEGMVVEPAELELCAGESARVRVSGEGAWPDHSTLTVTSNDLDEATVAVDIVAAAAGLGEPHEPFTLQVLEPVSGTTAPWSLTDYAGELVYIAWFAPT